MKIYDILGREVTTLVNERLTPGTYEVGWDASNFASGIYLYKLTVGETKPSIGGFVQAKKMVLMK